MKMLLLTLIGSTLLLASVCSGAPTDSERKVRNKRETPCIALADCPGMEPHSPKSSTSSPPLPPPPSITPPPTTSATPTSSPVAAKSAIDPYLYSCSDDQKAKVKEAWTEAASLASAHAKWKPPGWFSSGAYQPAQTMYLGSDSAHDTPWFGTGPLKRSSASTHSFDTSMSNSKVENIDRQQAIHQSAPLFTYGYFYCDEDKLPTKGKKTSECGPSTTAYTFDDLGTLWSAHYVVFCPKFWGDSMSSLAQLVEEGKNDSTLQGVMNPWRYARARSLFHETYHWGTTVSQPKCNRRPEKYTPKDVVDLAKNGNTKEARLNAESWAQAAMAMYLQQTFNLKSPPVPQPENPIIDSSLMSHDTGPLEEGFLDEMPDWFAPPVAQDAPTFKPDMADVVQISRIE